MVRLIDADALLETFRNWTKILDYNEAEQHIIRHAIAAVKEKPTVDAEPVRHGRWVEYPECLKYDGAYSEDHIVCSVCGDVWSIMDNDADRFDYCPHCGSRMDGDVE